MCTRKWKEKWQLGSVEKSRDIKNKTYKRKLKNKIKCEFKSEVD